MKGDGFSLALLQISGSKASNKPQGMKTKTEQPQSNSDVIREHSVGRTGKFSLHLGPNDVALNNSNQTKEEA